MNNLHPIFQEALKPFAPKPTDEKVQLVCNECGKKRFVSAEGNYNERCPKCGGVDWDVIG